MSTVSVYKRTRGFDKKVRPAGAHRHSNQGGGKRNTYTITNVYAAVALLVLLPIR